MLWRGWEVFTGELGAEREFVDLVTRQTKRVVNRTRVPLTEGQHFHQPLRFTNAYFPHGLNLSRCVFSGPVVFRDCVFVGEVKFCDSEFHGSVHFKKCLFLTGDQDKAEPSVLIDMHRSRFHGYASFHGCYIDGGLEAEGARFEMGFIFRKHLDVLGKAVELFKRGADVRADTAAFVKKLKELRAISAPANASGSDRPWLERLFGQDESESKDAFGSLATSSSFRKYLEYGCYVGKLSLCDVHSRRDVDLGGIYVAGELDLSRTKVEASVKLTYIPRLSEETQLSAAYPSLPPFPRSISFSFPRGLRTYVGGRLDLHNLKVDHNMSIRGVTLLRGIDARGLEVRGRLALRPNRHMMNSVARFSLDSQSKNRRKFQTQIFGTVDARHAKIGVLDLRGVIARQLVDFQGLATEKVNIEPYPLSNPKTPGVAHGTPIIARFEKIDISNAEIKGDLLAPCLHATSVYARGCRIQGSVNLRSRKPEQGGATHIRSSKMEYLGDGLGEVIFSLWMPDSFIGGYFSLSGASFDSFINLARVDISGKFYLHSFENLPCSVGVGMLPSGDFVSMFLDGSTIRGTIWADGLQCKGMLDLRCSKVADLLLGIDKKGRLANIGWLRLSGATLQKDLFFRGCIIQEALIAESMDLHGSLEITTNEVEDGFHCPGLMILSTSATVPSPGNAGNDVHLLNSWLSNSGNKTKKQKLTGKPQVPQSRTLPIQANPPKQLAKRRKTESIPYYEADAFSVWLKGAQIRGSLLIQGGFFRRGVFADDLKVEGDAVLTGHKTKDVETDHPLHLGQGSLGEHQQFSLALCGARLQRGISLTGVTCVGGVDLAGAELHKDLIIEPMRRPGQEHVLFGITSSIGSSTTAGSPRSYSLWMRVATIRGQVKILGAIINGGICLLDAKIDGSVAIGEAWISEASSASKPRISRLGQTRKQVEANIDKAFLNVQNKKQTPSNEKLVSLVGRSKHNLRYFGLDFRNSKIQGPINLSGLLVTDHETPSDDCSYSIKLLRILSKIRILNSEHSKHPEMQSIYKRSGNRCDVLFRGCICSEVHVGGIFAQLHKQHLRSYINGTFDANNLHVRGSVIISDLTVTGIFRFRHADIGGEVEIRGVPEQVVKTVKNAIALPNAYGLIFVREGDAKPRNPLEPVDFTSARIKGSLDLSDYRGPGILLKGAQVDGALILRNANLDRAAEDSYEFSLLLTNSTLGSFQGEKLKSVSRLLFDSCTIKGSTDLTKYDGSGLSFVRSQLDGALILKDANLNEPLGKSSDLALQLTNSHMGSFQGQGLKSVASLSFEGCIIKASIDLTDYRGPGISLKRAQVDGDLVLKGATLNQSVDGSDLSSLQLANANIGSLQGQGLNSVSYLSFDGCTIKSTLDLTNYVGAGISLERAQIDGALLLNSAFIEQAAKEESQLGLLLTNSRLGAFQGCNLVSLCGLAFDDSIVNTSIDLTEYSGPGVSLKRVHVDGDLIITHVNFTHPVENGFEYALELTNAQLGSVQGQNLRSASGLSFDGCTIRASIDLKKYIGPGISCRRAQVDGALILTGALLGAARDEGNQFGLMLSNSRLGTFHGESLESQSTLSFEDCVVVGDTVLSNATITASLWEPDQTVRCLLASGAKFGLDLLLNDTRFLKSPIQIDFPEQQLNFDGATVSKDCRLDIDLGNCETLKLSCRRLQVGSNLELPLDYYRFIHDLTDAQLGRIKFLLRRADKAIAGGPLSSYGGMSFSECEFKIEDSVENVGFTRKLYWLFGSSFLEIFFYFAPWIFVAFLGYWFSQKPYLNNLLSIRSDWLVQIPFIVMFFLLGRILIGAVDVFGWISDRNVKKVRANSYPGRVRARVVVETATFISTLALLAGMGPLRLKVYNLTNSFRVAKQYPVYGFQLVLVVESFLIFVFIMLMSDAVCFLIERVISQNEPDRGIYREIGDHWNRSTANVELSDRRYEELAATLALIRYSQRSISLVQRMITRFDAVGARSMADYLYIVGRSAELIGRGPGSFIESGVRAYTMISALPYILLNLFFADFWLIVFIRSMAIGGNDNGHLITAFSDSVHGISPLSADPPFNSQISIALSSTHHISAYKILFISVLIARVLLIIFTASIAGSLSMMNRRQRQVGNAIP